MGFYGNITNTSNTTFSFDKIYSNRREMDSNANNDGIFIGRYVLVEYDQDAAYPNVFLKDGQYYSSPNTEDLTRVRFLSGERYDYILTTDEYPIKGKQYYIKIEDGVFEPVDIKSNTRLEVNKYYEKVESVDGVYKEEIVQVQKIDTDEKGHTTYINIGFYECVGFVTENSIKYATFQKITKDPTAKSNYIQNFAIDEKHQDAEQQKSFKGYDSTVWVKSSIITNDGKLITKYVNIADLNSVVPTFDIAADAPTMTPITPHFDADSTNVYYKLHIQPQWGMRVAAANGSNSDVETYWTRENYNPSTGLSTKQYWNKNSGNWVNYDNEEEIQTFDAAIYYNRAGFEEYTRKHVDASLEDNIINIEPTGESGNLYSNHNKDNNNSTAKDIQEIRINLPAIGNMMSDAWDIIHGKQRNDYRGDGENASLQGRLDSFDAFYDNQIPVKRTNDGKIIGSRINGAAQYDNSDTWENEEKPVEVLYDTTSPNFNRDDAWIKTEVFTTGLKDGDKDTANDQGGNSGISIHHTFHATTDSTSSVDKNIENGNIKTDAAYKSDKIQSNNLLNINSKKDFIELYTPYVDAKGHVVGKNIETVTLPYGYKTIKAATQSTAVTDPSTNTIEVIADSTQDTLQFASSNKWIKMSGTNKGKNINYDTFNIGHEVHSIDETVSDQGDNKTSHTNANKENGAENEINLTMYDWTYDEAGHITSKRQHTYTLPYGFKTINVGNDTTESAAPAQMGVEGETADSTQDSLTFTPTNKWIKMVATGNDEIKFGHELTEINSKSDTNFGLSSDMSVAQVDANDNQFNVPVFQFDKAGHITKAETHTISLPDNFVSHVVEISDATDKDSTTGETGTITPDALTDTLKFVEGNRWINLEADTTNDIITFSHYAKDFPESTDTIDFDSSSNTTNSFDIQNIAWDRAGHITASNKINYTLPKSIKTLSIQDTGKDSVNVVTGSTGQLTADNLVDTMTIDNGNRWIRLVANGKTVKLYHDAPNSASSSGNTTNANDNNDKTLSFNSTFEVPQVQYDETGHIFGIGKHTITLPSTSTLRLNNYSKGTSTAAITTNETINNAFGKLENRLDVLQGGNTQVGSVAYQIAQIVNENNNGSVDTLNEIANWIINDSTGAAKMANDIATLKGNDTVSGSVANSIKNAIDGLDSSISATTENYISGITITNGKITDIEETIIPVREVKSGTTNGTILVNGSAINVGGLKSAAYTNSSDYARANVLDTEFTYGSDKKTIQDLMNIVKAQADTIAELTTRIEALEPESETLVEGE